MIKLLTATNTQRFQKLRLKGLKTDPKSFLATYQMESTRPDFFFQTKLRYATKPPIFGYYGYFKDSKSPKSAKVTGSGNGGVRSLREAASRRRTGRLVGFIQIDSEYHPKNKHLANLYSLYVHPNYRKKGIATKLINHTIKLAKSQESLEQIHLRANSDNKNAIKLYKKVGFTHFATRQKAFKEADGTYQDELFFSLDLK